MQDINRNDYKIIIINDRVHNNSIIKIDSIVKEHQNITIKIRNLTQVKFRIRKRGIYLVH